MRRELAADEPNQVWFADITHVPTWKGWFFLTVVMDACAKRIVGCSMRRHTFKTRDQARFEVLRYVEGFCNPHRRSSSLGNLSPTEIERRLEQRQLQAAAS